MKNEEQITEKKQKKHYKKTNINKKYSFMIFIVSALGFAFNYFLIWVLSFTTAYKVLGNLLVIGMCVLSSFFVFIVLLEIISRLMFRDYAKFISGMESIAQGDYSVRLNLTSSEEMKNLSACFNKMAEELSSVEILKNDFISNFSHEFKTPIASIKGFVELLKKGNLTQEERAQYFEIITTEINMLSELATNTLLLSKLNTQKDIGIKETINSAEIIGQAILLQEKSINEKHIDIEVDLKPVKMHYNPDFLRQICINILSNAIKFVDDGGKISVTSHEIKVTKHLEIIFKDNGCGMNEQTVMHIFDNYYQGDPSHSTKGYGLGLSIVRKIIDLSYGSIDVKSEPNKGSVFTVLLPTDF